MQLGKILAGGLAVVLLMPPALCAQEGSTVGDPPETVSLRLGPLALAPALNVTNFGWDSNIFQRRSDEPTGDVTSTFSPEVQSWLRLGRARVQLRNELDFAYFRDHPDERSVDSAHEGRLDLPLAHVTPYVSASWLSARQRFGFEIDERTRRHQETGRGGVIVRLGSRTKIDVAAHRNRMEFNTASGFRDPLLTDFYDYTSHGVAFTVQRDLTPLTSLAVTVDRHQDRFDLAPQRDSNSIAINSGLEFKPFALITGRAFVGWNRVRLIEPGGRSFRGAVASIDLAYTLLGSTRFVVQAQRNLSYSAVRGQHAFLLSGVRGSVTHRLADSWDIGLRTGRHRVSYGFFDLVSDSSSSAGESLGLNPNRELVTEYGGEAGYRLAPDIRVAFGVVRYHRDSSLSSDRQYAVTRAGMSLRFGL